MHYRLMNGKGVATLVLAAWLGLGADATMANTPEIHAFEATGDPLSAHRADGAWTLVMFWSVTCGICATEAPVLSTFHEQEKDRGVHVLGVSLDGAGMRDAVAQWMTRHRMEFPTLLGDLTQVAAYFSAATDEPFRGTPSFMLFAPDGRLLGVNVGPVRVDAVRKFIARKQQAD